MLRLSLTKAAELWGVQGLTSQRSLSVWVDMVRIKKENCIDWVIMCSLVCDFWPLQTETVNQQALFGNVHVLTCQETSTLQVGAILLAKLVLSFSGIRSGMKGNHFPDIILSKCKITIQSSCGQVDDGNIINIKSSQLKKTKTLKQSKQSQPPMKS